MMCRRCFDSIFHARCTMAGLNSDVGVDVDAGKCNVSRQLALIINRNIVSWLWVPTCADLQSKQEKIMSTHFIIVPLFLSIILVLLSPTSALIPTIIAAHQQQQSNGQHDRGEMT